MNIEGLPPTPKWDDEGATIDLPLVDQIIDEVSADWGVEVQDYSDPEWPAMFANGFGSGEAVEYGELYAFLRDLVQHTINQATNKKGGSL